MNSTKRNYDDIINLPHHVSKVHLQMPLGERAAQFSPFAALSGYGERVRDAAREKEEQIELYDLEKITLDE